MAEKSSELNILDQSNEDIDTENKINDAETENQPENYDLSGRDDTENASEDSPPETEQIREQIEETRREMGETIDAIQEKLSFDKISEQVKEQVSEQINNAVETAKDAVYDATIRKAGSFMQNVGKELKRSNIVKTMGQNPLPFVFIGLGVGLLLFKNYNRGSSSTKYQSRSNNGERDNSSLLKSAQDKITSTANQTYESLSNAAGSAYGSVSSAANSAYQGLGSTVHDTYDMVGQKYNYYLEEKPLAIGAVALAHGAAVGMAVPSTEYEDGLLGEVNENLKSKAETAARQAFDKVQQVAGEVGKTITGEEEKGQGMA